MHLKKTVEVNGVQTEEPRQLHFFYDKDAQPIMVRLGGDEEECQYFTFVKNLQGDVLGILGKTLDNAGVLRVEYLYDPWGRPLRSLTTAYDESAAVLAELNPFRYRGYLYDEETGLYYLRTRYYNPEWGRFINADGFAGEPGVLLAHNLFAYCKNSPTMLTDPSGTAPARSGYDEWIYQRQQANRSVWQKIGDFITECTQIMFQGHVIAEAGRARAVSNLSRAALSQVERGTFGVLSSGTAEAGAGLTGSAGIVFDTQGNYGYLVSGGGGAGTIAASLGMTFQATNAPSIEKLEGLSISIGGSTPVVGVDSIIFQDRETREPYWGGSIAVGLFASPTVVEFHAMATHAGLLARGNIFDGLDKYASIMEKIGRGEMLP